MANILVAVVLLYCAANGNARNMQLVLVDDAITEVGYCVPCVYSVGTI